MSQQVAAPGRGVRRIPGQMNKLEASYAVYLNQQKSAGLVLEYWFEGITFRLATDTRYTPDFLVQMPDLTLECHETKGFMRDDAAVKLKVAAAMFPFRFRLCRRSKAGWIIKDYSLNVDGSGGDEPIPIPRRRGPEIRGVVPTGPMLDLRRKVIG